MTKRPDDTRFAQSVTAAILCRNFQNPITGDVLATQFSVDLRKITEVVAQARDAGIKIASSKGAKDEYLGVIVPAGYYAARTPEEMRSTYDDFQQLIRKLSHRAKRMMDFSGQSPSVFEQGVGEEEAA